MCYFVRFLFLFFFNPFRDFCTLKSKDLGLLSTHICALFKHCLSYILYYFILEILLSEPSYFMFQNFKSLSYFSSIYLSMLHILNNFFKYFYQRTFSVQQKKVKMVRKFVTNLLTIKYFLSNKNS